MSGVLVVGFERFVENSPISVMVRGILERVLGAEHLDAWYERTTHKPYTRAIFFSTVYELLSQVVFRLQPSGHAAYRKHADTVGTALLSVYNKLNGLATHTAAALVRHSATGLRPLIVQLGGACAPWLPGARVKIVDGNGMETTEHRLKALRARQGGALPGKALVVYEPAAGLVTDVFPREDGHTQERSLFGHVLDTVHAGALWIQDRNFCPWTFLCGIAQRDAWFITRQHERLPYEIVSPFRAAGRIETDHVAEQRVCVRDVQGIPHYFRRIRVTLATPTRNGDSVLYLLTNLPPHRAAAKRVARLYRKRWILETALQRLEAYCHSAINTLGYPKAAFFGFCLALVAYNTLAVVMAALRGMYGEETLERNISLYYIANELATTYQGMMIAIPDPEWAIFGTMSLPEMVATCSRWQRKST